MSTSITNTIIATHPSSGNSGQAHLYVNYTVNTTDTTVTISGSLYVEYRRVGITGSVDIEASAGQLAIAGTSYISGATKSLHNQTYTSWVRSGNIGTFSHTVNRPASSTDGSVTLSFGGHLDVTYVYSASAIAIQQGNVHTSVDIPIPHRTAYTISYNANGGTGTTPSSQTKYYGVDITLRTNSGLSRSGYVFRRWNTAANGSGTNYNSGATYSTNAGATMYAQWHQNPAILKMTNSGGGNYYKNANNKPYTVTVTSIATYDSATITSIKLTVGSQTTTLSNVSSGTLSITPNALGTFTPTVTITDSLGGTSSMTTASITVKENTAPTGAATTTSTGYYYAGATTKPYTVNVTSASGTNGKTISSIVLKVGTATASRTTTGTLSVVPPTVANGVSVTVVITDNLGVPYTALSTTINVLSNDEPTISYSYASDPPYYVGSTPYKVTISNFQGKNHKTITSVKLNLGSQNATLTSAGTFSITPSTVSTSITPTIVVTDNIGKTKTYSLTAIAVSANDPPTCTAVVSSVPNYYAGVSSTKYRVTISDVSPKNGKTISSIVLTLGSQTASRTNAGVLEIVPNTVGTFSGNTAPTVKITDHIGKYTTYTLVPSTVVVYENKEPTATVNQSTATVFYANAPQTGTSSTPYTVSVSNLQAYNEKQIVSATLKIGPDSKSITANGPITIYPSTAGTWTPTVVVEDNIGKTKTYSLTTITVNALVAQFSDMTVQRIAASSGTTGVIDDEGINAILRVKVDYSKYAGNYLLKPIVSVGDTQTAALVWYTGWTNSGGFTGEITDSQWNSSYQPNNGIYLYAKITYVFNIDNSYIIKVTPRTTAKTGSIASATLAQAFYLLAGRAGGHALGIGKKPVTDGVLDVGMQSLILNNYDGNPPSIDYQGAVARYPMIRFVDNASDQWGNGIVIGGGGLVIVGGGESSTAVLGTYTTGGSESLDLASDGEVNIWANVQNGTATAKKSVFNASGDLTIPRYMYASYLNQSSGAETPSSSSYWMYANSDGFLRKSSLANVNSLLSPIVTPYEANLQRGKKNFAGDYGVLDSAIIPYLGANRLAFAKAAGVTIEYTRNAGSSWTDYGATDTQKSGLFESGDAWFYIGKADSTNKATANGANYQLRVTLDTESGSVYTVLNKFALYISTGGSASCTVTIQKALKNTPTTFENVVVDVPLAGWSGWNIINDFTPFTTYGNTATSQYVKIRFIFKANGGNTSYVGLNINKILGFGGMGWTTPSYMALRGHLYTYDGAQNATFPAQVTATQFNGRATKLKDYSNNNDTWLDYGAAALTSCTYLGAWNGYRLGAIKPENITAGKVLYPDGFSSRTTGATWGNTTGTGITSWNTSTGGSIDFRTDNPSSGKLSVKVDGRFYFAEGNIPTGGLKWANSYWGMADPDGGDTNWIRTTSSGIIPYQSGGEGSGHCGLGTSGWRFSYVYADSYYGTFKGPNLELSPSSSSAGHGGYIDFHFNQSSADYTSRIIESASGAISINASNGTLLNGPLKVGGYKVITIGSVSAAAKSVPANGYADPAISVSVAKTGYTAIGIVGYTMGGSSYCYPYRIYVSGNTAYAYVRNPGSSAASLTVTFYVLYVASTQGV